MKNIISAATAILMLLAITLSLVVMPAALAQSTRKITSYAYISAEPNPVGVGQTTYISVWVDASLPEALFINDIRRHDYKLTITAPDGTKTSNSWPVVYDTTGVVFMSYKPTETGNYTILFEYGGQVFTWNSTSAERQWTGTTFLPTTRTETLIVQQEPLPDPMRSYPLPTEYWTRPIEGQNLDWYTLASNWLRGSQFGAFATPGGRLNLWQRDGAGPNSAHIMWKKPVEFGGVVGGGNLRANGSTYYSGGSYEGRFGDALIMHGRLYFTMPLGHSGAGGGYICLDLRTGEELWYDATLGTGIAGGYSDSKGEVYDFDSQNQHGAGGGILWQISGSTWGAYDGFTGKWLYNLTGVPSGTEVYTERGEIVRYVFNYQKRWMALWNWTQAPGTRGSGGGYANDQWRPNGKVIDTSTAYTWNVTIPDLPGSASPQIIYILPDDLIIGISSPVTTGTYGMANRGMTDPWTAWAISDKPNSRGQLAWIKNYTAPPGDIGLTFGPLDPINRVWTMAEAETFKWRGFSVDNGNPLWGPTGEEARDMQFFSSGSGAGQRAVTAYGNFYVQGYGGEIFAYSAKDGSFLWKFNDTYSGLQSPWGLMPTLLAAVADGKVYAFNNEHSPNSPLYRGYQVYCIDAFTGEEVWKMDSWAGTIGGHGVSTCVLAEGFFSYYNFYDNSVYSIGKGPSSTSVIASPKVSVEGNSVLIEGTVIDIAAGTKQDEQAARFPNGVPAVSDESMSGWMEYVYMQKPKPTDTTGVEVVLSVLDSNNNTREIGKTTSDANGFFSFQWTPDIPGKYTVHANFLGSDSYWPSRAEAAFVVDEAATPAETPGYPQPIDNTLTIVGVGIALLIAIAIVGAVMVTMFRKRA
jgi:outer membrane protein assembly factor BamB